MKGTCLTKKTTIFNFPNTPPYCFNPRIIVIPIYLTISNPLPRLFLPPTPFIRYSRVNTSVSDESYMALLCYKNGSLTREKIRDLAANGTWSEFNNALQNTRPGNDGNIGIYFIDQEIIPNARGTYRWNSKNQKVESFENSIEVRALVEGQFIAKKLHAEKLGYSLGKLSVISCKLFVFRAHFPRALYLSPIYFIKKSISSKDR